MVVHHGSSSATAPKSRARSHVPLAVGWPGFGGQASLDNDVAELQELLELAGPEARPPSSARLVRSVV